ncbi:hypothetical protein DENSPDRAFT_563377 [Dentipellis sp. KUC8613]|nr:hypothetical protein DENSPDRAFT_563377 [Dentipellis sp. KUC8613]
MDSVALPDIRAPCPIDRLPMELLSKIFSETKTLQSGSHKKEACPILCPISTSHVCRRWRSISLASPLLWTDLYISHSHKHLARIDAFLERSASQLLDITIRWCPYDSNIGMGHWPRSTSVVGAKERRFTRIFDKLIVHLARWHAFDFSTDTWWLMLHVFDIRDAAPALRQLRLDILPSMAVGSGPSPMATNYPPFGGALQQLQSLYIGNVPLDWSRCTFADLRSLVLLEDQRSLNCHPSEFLRIISSSPAIKSLYLSLRDYPQDAMPVELPMVESLTILTMHQEEFIKLLSVPRIRGLELRIMGHAINEAVDALTEPRLPLCRPLIQPLLAMRLSCLECTAERRHALYSSLPNLRLLDLQEHGFLYHTTFAEDMIHPDRIAPVGANTDVYMPHLSTVILMQTDWSLLRQLVETRRAAGVPLRKLVIYDRDVSGDEAAWLAENLETLASMPLPGYLSFRPALLLDWLDFEAARPGTWEFEDACSRIGCVPYRGSADH